MTENPKRVIVAEFFKNTAESEKYVIQLNEFNDVKYVDARLHYFDERNSEWRFTRKGVNVNEFNLDSLIEGLQTAQSFIGGKKKLGIIDNNDYQEDNG